MAKAKVKKGSVLDNDAINEMIANETIVQADFATQMEDYILNYAIETITDRALPDVRDGLKPVHRRILYGGMKFGYPSNKNYKKSAKFVGDILGNLHAHGKIFM